MNTRPVIKKHSVIGRFHLEHEQENQDVLYHGQDEYYSVISLADGVSTCNCAKRGAEIASQTITDLFLKEGERLFSLDDYTVSRTVLSCVMRGISEEAEKQGEPVSEYSSTLASVLIDKRKKKMLSFNVGDSIILASEKQQIRVIAIPSDSRNGCVVTTTQGADLASTIKLNNLKNVESIMICSDGAWREMFLKGRLKPEVRKMLIGHEFDTLNLYLEKMDVSDDHSFIAVDLMNK